MLLSVAALVIAAWLALSPASAGGTGSACEPAERLAPHATYDAWDRTVLGPQLRLPDGYEPPDLVSAGRADFDARFLVRSLVVDDLRRMEAAATADRVRLVLRSAYRSAEAQGQLREEMIRDLGRSAADRVVARAGHSEHQLGTALDFADTPGAHAWLTEHAGRFGFVRSYDGSHPCIEREDWHFRYLGADLSIRRLSPAWTSAPPGPVNEARQASRRQRCCAALPYRASNEKLRSTTRRSVSATGESRSQASRSAASCASVAFGARTRTEYAIRS